MIPWPFDRIDRLEALQDTAGDLHARLRHRHRGGEPGLEARVKILYRRLVRLGWAARKERGRGPVGATRP